MSRYAFSLPTLRPDPKDLVAAVETATGLGAKVVRQAKGAMVIEAPPTVARKLGEALPQWKVHVEGGTYKVPERKPLERAKLAADAKRR